MLILYIFVGHFTSIRNLDTVKFTERVAFVYVDIM